MSEICKECGGTTGHETINHFCCECDDYAKIEAELEAYHKIASEQNRVLELVSLSFEGGAIVHTGKIGYSCIQEVGDILASYKSMTEGK